MLTWRSVTILLLVCCVARLWAQTRNDPDTTITIPMSAHFDTVSAQPLSVETVTRPFLKEPSLQGDRITRGMIKLTEPETDLPFIWEVKSGRLYADLNLNSDLSDDGPPRELSATTKTVQLENATSSAMSGMAIQATFTANGKEPGFHRLRSYQGSFELAGKKWSALAYRRQGARETYEFSFGPQGPNLLAGTRWTSRISVIDGHQFLADFGYAPVTGKPMLELSPLKSSGYGELVLPGQNINYVYMMGNVPPEDAKSVTQTSDSMRNLEYSQRAFILHDPAPRIRVPAGHYEVYSIALNDGSYGLMSPSGQKVTVKKDEQTTLLIGGPVKNTVVAETLGSYVKLSYRRKGIGGEEYYSSPADQACFAIFKGERKILSGNFEYG